MVIKFENEDIEIEQNENFEFLISNSEVAKGYGISEITLRRHKNGNKDELIENKHFIFQTVQTNGGKQKKLFWTKRGIVRLGFFIKSERAKKFRDWAEDLILNIKKRETPTVPTLENNIFALETAIKILKVNEASKILMLSTLYTKLGLETSYLPKYSFDENHTYSLSTLLKKFEVGISANKMNKLLISNGLLEIKTRKSSKTEVNEKGEKKQIIKTFKSITVG